ncbi:hypothetical protein B7454_03685 [Staphylococcus lugdunensis]|nr:hypothetical protein B7454_03685 [Staphylococcus lugdunensis]ARJ28994.1 hypothetical protein B6N84_02955 [Staphylococcus lugdunensis]
MNIQYFSNTLDRTSPGASTKRISIRNSTSTASWGGAPTKRLSKKKPTYNASWGASTKRLSIRNSTSKEKLAKPVFSSNVNRPLSKRTNHHKH